MKHRHLVLSGNGGKMKIGEFLYKRIDCILWCSGKISRIGSFYIELDFDLCELISFVMFLIIKRSVTFHSLASAENF